MNIKLIKYGEYADMYIFRNSQLKLGARMHSNKKKSDERREEYKQRTKYRNVGTVKRLISANFNHKSLFLTLTFDPVKNLVDSSKSANILTKLFIKRLKKMYPDIKFLYVLEKHKSGLYHVHFVCNLPFIPQPTLLRLWAYGLVRIVKLYKSISAGSYLAKYITKDFGGSRTYFASRNLTKPTIHYFSDRGLDVLAHIGKPSYNYSYKSDLYGNIDYYTGANLLPDSPM